MPLLKKVYKIKGTVQHYTWGGKDFIPQLLSIENEEAKPYAEYWLGTHPKSPSIVVDENISLNDFVEQNKDEILGSEVSQKFGGLPYLFKILDVQQMLSIQVHPDKKSAEKGYVEETDKGIDLAAFNRNFKDKNHKPELMVALSDFWLLHGFKPEELLVGTFNSIPELSFFTKIFYDNGYEGLYREVMNMEQEKVDAVLSPLLQRIIPLYKSNELEKSQEHFWAARASLVFCNNGHYDRGIFSIYFLNLLNLKSGEGIFQPAGMPHAYLEGQNVEVMANSDNVLRAGLTDKHIDVNELIKHVKFGPTFPNIIKQGDDKSKEFSSPAEEFMVQQLFLETTYSYTSFNAEILFVLKGDVTVFSGDLQSIFTKGEAAFIIAGTSVVLQPGDRAEVFRVFTP